MVAILFLAGVAVIEWILLREEQRYGKYKTSSDYARHPLYSPADKDGMTADLMAFARALGTSEIETTVAASQEAPQREGILVRQQKRSDRRLDPRQLM